MNLDSIEQVQKLGRDRDTLRALRKLMTTSSMATIMGQVCIGGYKIGGLDLLPHELWINCLIECCSLELVHIETELKKLGVGVNDPEPVDAAETNVTVWKAQAGMYQRAWCRELGPHMGRNYHLIDALVTGTQKLREKAEANQRG